MSRRYGRNQKRRAAAEIAELKDRIVELNYGITLANALSRQLAVDKAKLQSQLDYVVRTLGPNFIGLPAPEAAFKVTEEVRRRGDFRMLVPGSDEIATMHLLSVEDSDDDVRNQIHLRVRLAERDVGYAISKQAIWATPADILARRLADELAPAFVTSLRAHGARP